MDHVISPVLIFHRGCTHNFQTAGISSHSLLLKHGVGKVPHHVLHVLSCTPEQNHSVRPNELRDPFRLIILRVTFCNILATSADTSSLENDARECPLYGLIEQFWRLQPLFPCRESGNGSVDPLEDIHSFASSRENSPAIAAVTQGDVRISLSAVIINSGCIESKHMGKSIVPTTSCRPPFTSCRRSFPHQSSHGARGSLQRESEGDFIHTALIPPISLVFFDSVIAPPRYPTTTCTAEMTTRSVEHLPTSLHVIFWGIAGNGQNRPRIWSFSPFRSKCTP